MDFFPLKITRKRGITHAPALFVQRLYFHLLDPKIDFLTLKMTLNNKINFRNGRSFSVIFVRH